MFCVPQAKVIRCLGFWNWMKYSFNSMHLNFIQEKSINLWASPKWRYADNILALWCITLLVQTSQLFRGFFFCLLICYWESDELRNCWTIQQLSRLLLNTWKIPMLQLLKTLRKLREIEKKKNQCTPISAIRKTVQPRTLELPSFLAVALRSCLHKQFHSFTVWIAVNISMIRYNCRHFIELKAHRKRCFPKTIFVIWSMGQSKNFGQ